MTWYLISDFTPVGPLAQCPAPGSVGGGYSDKNGSVWFIDSNGYLNQSSGFVQGYDTSELIRATSLDTGVDGQIAIRYGAANHASSLFAQLRYRTSNACYLVGINGTSSFSLASVNGGTSTGITPTVTSGSMTLTTPLTYGNDYDFIASCVQTSGSLTTFTASIYSVTSPSAAIGSGTLMGTVTFTDTTAVQQNAAGVMGVSMNGGDGHTLLIKRLQTFTDVPPSTATALVLAGPATGTPSTPTPNFVVTANGVLSSPITVTLTDGAGGVFTPSTLTLSAGSFSSGSFAYTPATTGAKSITASGGGLSSNTLAANQYPGSLIIPVNSSAFSFSPGNWKGDTGRGGSVYRQSWNQLAYFTFVFTAGNGPLATVLLGSCTGVAVSYLVNGHLYEGVTISGNLTLNGLTANAVNTVELFIVTSPASPSQSWNNATGVLKVLGMQIDGYSTPGVAPVRSKWIIWVGDSITAGYEVNGTTAVESFYSHTYVTMRRLMALGYDVCVNAIVSSGYIAPSGNGSGDVPAYYYVSSGAYNQSLSRWNLIDQGVSLLDGNGQISSYGAVNTAPSLIFVNYGTNECIGQSNTSDFQAAIVQCMTALRAAAPGAVLMPIIPFGLEQFGASYATIMKNAFAGYLALGSDALFQPQDFGINVANALSNNTVYTNTDGVHPTRAGHGMLAPLTTSVILAALTPAAGRSYSFS